MRAWVFVLAVVGSLSGCSVADPFMLSPGLVSLSNQVEPFPRDYMALARQHFGFKRQPNLQISRPRQVIGAGVMDPQRWYVCVRQPADLDEVVLVISDGKIVGAIPGPAPEFCDNGDYQPLG